MSFSKIQAKNEYDANQLNRLQENILLGFQDLENRITTGLNDTKKEILGNDEKVNNVSDSLSSNVLNLNDRLAFIKSSFVKNSKLINDNANQKIDNNKKETDEKIDFIDERTVNEDKKLEELIKENRKKTEQDISLTSKTIRREIETTSEYTEAVEKLLKKTIEKQNDIISDLNDFKNNINAFVDQLKDKQDELIDNVNDARDNINTVIDSINKLARNQEKLWDEVFG